VPSSVQCISVVKQMASYICDKQQIPQINERSCVLEDHHVLQADWLKSSYIYSRRMASGDAVAGSRLGSLDAVQFDTYGADSAVQ
jgi:S-ribosylhomocysteine lyase LuxS involved in autoinducer biosynthesis